MAGSEQRPTDDVEGHRRHFFGSQDTEAVDEDQVGDDTEGHGLRLPPEAVDEGQAGDDDTGGHVAKCK
jgi:hypothetical protein